MIKALTSDSSENESDGNLVEKQTGSKRSGQVPGPKSKRLRKEQSFVESWLNHDEFKKWLEVKREGDGKRKPLC